MKGDITQIYGVDLVGAADPHALVRTDEAVGRNVTVGASTIDSGFDNCYPWSDIEEVTDEFGNVFIKIPKFYSKITKNSDGTYKHQLSGVKHEGFDTLFKVGNNEIDYVMVGKYEGSGTSSRIYSKSGQPPLVSIKMDDYRNGCKANGEGYQQYDFLIDLIIKELWLVEMATTNCQSIMYGYANSNSSKINTGATDTVKKPTGSPESNTDGKHACKYRGIENPWGNIYKWCDGISFNGNSVYVCTEPTAYTAGKTTGLYEYYGTRPSSNGFVKTVAPLKEGSLIQYVTAVGADESSYYCDKSWQGGDVLYCGGVWSNGADAGLWFWAGYITASHTSNGVGGRLCYKPVVSFNPSRNRLKCTVKNNSTMLDCAGLSMFPLATTTTEAFYLQPASWADDTTGDLTKDGNAELEYLNYPHPFDQGTGEELINYTHINDSTNTKESRNIGECCLQSGDITNELVSKSWKAHFAPDGAYIWNSGDAVYYSNAKQQYQLDKLTSTWKLKTWTGLTAYSGQYVWTDGDDVYYSYGDNQYQLDRATSTWNKKPWNGLTSFDGLDVWTDGDNVYYSHGDNQYQLDRATSTWNKKTWNGKWGTNGESVWRDGNDIYSCYSKYQNFHNIVYYTKLDKTTSTWGEGQHWPVESGYEYEYVLGTGIWTHNGNVYFSGLDRDLVLNKTTKQWEHKNWHWLTDLPPWARDYETNEYRYFVSKSGIWFDGNDVYYTYSGDNYKLNDKTDTWERQTWIVEPVAINKQGIWTDGTNIYYEATSNIQTNIYYETPAVPYRLNGDTWELVSRRLSASPSTIWRDGEHVYHAAYSELDREKKEWVPVSWKGLTEFSGQSIWTDGVNMYCSFSTRGSYKHYKLDRTTATWNVQQWYGHTAFVAADIWTDGQTIYCSRGALHYQLDNATSTWNARSWVGIGDFKGANVWHHHNNVYCSIGDKHYQLQIEQNKWVPKTWEGDDINFSGANVWSQGDKFYVSNGAQQLSVIIRAPNVSQYNVWTDLKRVQVVTPAGPRVVQTKEPAKWDDTKFWVEGWDKETDTHMVQVKRHPQLTNKTLNIDCYMKNIDDLYTGLETCTLSYEDGPDGNSGTWYLKKPDGSTYITLKVTQTQKQEGQS